MSVTHESRIKRKSPKVKEENKVRPLFPLFPCKDNQDWVFDQSSEGVVAPTLLSSVSYPKQLGKNPRLIRRLVLIE